MTPLDARAAAIAASIQAAFAAPPRTAPFAHWILDAVLPPAVALRLDGLDAAETALGEGGGRRETHNSQRRFLNPAQQARDVDCAALALAMQSAAVVTCLGSRCGTHLHGTLLRIEYCRDSDGFWLEPHTDIGAKRFTLLIYLNTPPGGEEWGTDLYDADGTLLGTAPSRSNAGLAFAPGSDTWHGFRRRTITGIRRTLIVNYVVPDWRSVHELSFPGQPV